MTLDTSLRLHALTRSLNLHRLTVANESAPEYAQRPGFLSTLTLATYQGSKLGLSKNKSITCYCSTYQIVQLNWLPLVISFIAISSANTGLIISLEK
ncbi:unnamed protein product [Arctogadus glacialis]